MILTLPTLLSSSAGTAIFFFKTIIQSYHKTVVNTFLSLISSSLR